MGVAEALGHGHSRHSTIKSYIIFHQLLSATIRPYAELGDPSCLICKYNRCH